MSAKKELIQKTVRGSLVLGINLLTFALFFVRDILTSRYYGISAKLDAAYLAIMVPSLMANFLYQPLNDLLIPKYQNLLAKKENVIHLYLNVLIYVLLISVVLTLGLSALSHPIAALVASGFNVENQNLVSDFLRFASPIIIFGGLIITTNIYLNTIGKYVISASASLIVPIAAIAFMYISGVENGESVFITGMILGQILNFIVVQYYLVKYSSIKTSLSGFRLMRFRRELIYEYVTQNIVNFCFYGLSAISASFGTHYQEGTTTLVILVNKVIGFFTNLFNATYTSVLMPYMSRIYLDSKDRFKNESRQFLIVITAASLVGVIAVAFGAEFVSHLLFFSSKITNEQKVDFIKYIRLGIFQVPLLITMVFFFKWLTINSRYLILSILASAVILGNVLGNVYLKNYFGASALLLAPYLIVLAVMMVCVNFVAGEKMRLSLFDRVTLTTLWLAMTALLFGFIV